MRRNRSFFEQPTVTVARQLLGDVLHVNGRLVQISETEAYVGTEDRANHASRGRTKRTEPLFGPAGVTYAYLVYGMHWCLNIVTEEVNFPAAVLIRAVIPIDPKDDPKRTNGPGKLSRWLGIDGSFNSIDSATSSNVWVETEPNKPELIIRTGPRIGVAYAGDWAKKPWRFWIKGNPYVSK